MSDEDALLAAIIANPDEDTPRLVYADWLDDNAGAMACPRCKGINGCGEPAGPGEQDCHGSGAVPDGNAERAEFIRVQVAYEWGPFDTRHLSAEREALITRLRQLCVTLGPRVLSDGWEVWPTPMLPTQERLWRECRGPAAAFTRGFIGEVRLPLAAFAGGPCGRCGGRTWWHRDGAEDDPRDVGGPMDCHDCDMTGRTPGLAAGLFAAHPIARVVLTDRERRSVPHLTERSSAVYGWTRDGGYSHRPSWLPDELWSHLPPGEVEEDGYHCWFALADALAALSAACVAYGRDLAGLRVPG